MDGTYFLIVLGIPLAGVFIIGFEYADEESVKSETDLRDFKFGTLFWPASLCFGNDDNDARRAVAVLMELFLLALIYAFCVIEAVLLFLATEFAVMLADLGILGLGAWSLGRFNPVGLLSFAFNASPITAAAANALVCGAGAELNAPTPVYDVSTYEFRCLLYIFGG